MATEGSGMSKHDKYLFGIFGAIFLVVVSALQSIIVGIAALVLQWILILISHEESIDPIELSDHEKEFYANATMMKNAIGQEYKPLDLNGNGAHDRVE